MEGSRRTRGRVAEPGKSHIRRERKGKKIATSKSGGRKKELFQPTFTESVKADEKKEAREGIGVGRGKRTMVPNDFRGKEKLFKNKWERGRLVP